MNREQERAAAHARHIAAIIAGDWSARAAAVRDIERCWPSWREVMGIINAGAVAIRAKRESER